MVSSQLRYLNQGRAPPGIWSDNLLTVLMNHTDEIKTTVNFVFLPIRVYRERRVSRGRRKWLNLTPSWTRSCRWGLGRRPNLLHVREPCICQEGKQLVVMVYKAISGLQSAVEKYLVFLVKLKFCQSQLLFLWKKNHALSPTNYLQINLWSTFILKSKDFIGQKVFFCFSRKSCLAKLNHVILTFAVQVLREALMTSLHAANSEL